MMVKDANEDARGRNNWSLEEICSPGIEEWRDHETCDKFLDGDKPEQSGTVNKSTSLE